MASSLLFHLAVGRLVKENGEFVPDKHEILASCTHASMLAQDSDYVKHAKQIMNTGSAKLTSGKRADLAAADNGAGSYNIHVLADTAGDTLIFFFAMTTQKFGQAHRVNVLLGEFQTKFLAANTTGEIESAKSKTIQKKSGPLFEELFTTYGPDKLGLLHEKVEGVKKVMQKNVQKALENTEVLTVIEEKAEALEQRAGEFNDRARDTNRMMKCRQYKLQAIIGSVVLIVLIIIIIAAATGGSN